MNKKSKLIDKNWCIKYRLNRQRDITSVGEPGAETFYWEQESEPLEKLYGAGARALKPYLMGAGALKPYLMGAGAEAGKNPLKTAPRESGFSKAKAGKRNL